MGYGAYIIFAKVSDSLPRYFSETGYIRILCVSNVNNAIIIIKT